MQTNQKKQKVIFEYMPSISQLVILEKIILRT